VIGGPGSCKLSAIASALRQGLFHVNFATIRCARWT
jgi:hypothetical protein